MDLRQGIYKGILKETNQSVMNKKILIFALLTILLVALLAVSGIYLYQKRKSQTRNIQQIQLQARAAFESGKTAESTRLWLETARHAYIPKEDAVALSEKLLLNPVSSDQQASQAMQEVSQILSSSISGNLADTELLTRIARILIRQGKASNPAAWQILTGLCDSILERNNNYAPAKQYKALSGFYAGSWLSSPDKSIFLHRYFNDLNLPGSPLSTDREILTAQTKVLLALADDAGKDRDKAARYRQQALDMTTKAANDNPGDLEIQITRITTEVAAQKLIPDEYLFKINELFQKTNLGTAPPDDLVQLGSLLRLSARINPSQDDAILKFYPQAIAIAPENPALKADYAFYLLQTGKNEEALQRIREVLDAKNPLPPLDWIERNVIRADAAYKYANYLIQKASATADDQERIRLIDSIPAVLDETARSLSPVQLALLQAKTAFIRGQYQQALAIADQIPPLQGPEESEKLFLAAESAIRLGLIGEAKERYRKIIISQGVSFPVRLRFAQLLLQTAEYDVLLNQLNSFSNEEKKHPAVRELEADLLMKQGKTREALTLYDEILKATADNQKETILLKKSMAASRVGNRDIALNSIEDILKKDPANINAVKLYILTSNDLDACKKVLGRATQAGMPPLFSDLYHHLLQSPGWSFEKMSLGNLRGSSVNADTYLEIAKTYMAWEKPETAMKILEEGFKKYPASFRLLEMQLDQALASKDSAALNRILQTARDQNVDGVGGLYFQAVAMAAQGNTTDAAKLAGEIVKKSPSHTGTLFLLARLDLSKQDFTSAKRRLDQITTIDPAHAPSLSILADLEFRNGQDEKALEYVKRALTQDPQNATYLAQFLSIQQAKLPAENALNLRKKISEAAPEFSENTQALTLMYLEQGKLEDALHMANLDAINDKSPYAQRAFKAQILAATGKIKEAVDSYSKLVKEAPGKLDITERYIYLLIMTGNFNEALSQISLTRKQSGNNNILLVEESLAHQNKSLNTPDRKEASEQLEKAIEALSRHITLHPNDSRNLQLARLKLAAGYPSDAIFPNIDKAIQANPQFPEAVILRAQLHFQEGKTESAIDGIRAALKGNPDHLPYYFQLHEFYQGTGQSRHAQSILDDAIRKFPKNTQLYTMRMMFFLNMDDLSSALKDAEISFSLSPSALTLSNYIQACLQGKNISQAKKLLSENEALVKVSPVLQSLEARILVLEDNPREAVQIYEKLFQSAQHFALARLIIDMTRQSLGAQEAERILLSVKGKLPAAEQKLMLIQLLTQTRQSTKAARLLSDLPESQFKEYFPQYMGIVLSLQDTLSTSESIPLLKKALSIDPKNTPLLIALARAQASTGSIDSAKKTLEISRENAPLESSLTLIDILLNQMSKAGDNVTKDKIGYEVGLNIDQFIRNYPADPRGLLLRASYNAELKKFKEAAESAEKALKQDPSSAAAVILLCRIRYEQGDKMKALGEAEFYLNKFPRQLAVRHFYADMLQDTNSPKYNDFINASLRFFPHDTIFLVKKAEIESKKDKKAAIRYYESALAQSPQNPPLLNNLAYLLMETGQYDQAQSYAVKALEITPHDPYILDTLGRIQFLKNDLVSAQATLEKSVFFKPLPDNCIHLAELHLKTGNKDRATQYLNQAKSLVDSDKSLLEKIRSLEKELSSN